MFYNSYANSFWRWLGGSGWVTQGAQIPARKVSTQLDWEGIWLHLGRPSQRHLIFLQCNHQILCYLACLNIMWHSAGNNIA